VEQSGSQRWSIEAIVGQDLGYSDRMGYVGIAGLANLTSMRRLGDSIRVLELADVGVGIVTPVRLDDPGESRLSRI
jgi:hypothetical protein